MIKLDIDSLPDGHTHRDLVEEASELDMVLEGGRLTSPVSVSLDIDRSGDEILISGRASVEASLECARCLGEYGHALGAPIQVVITLGDVQEGGQRENLIQVPRGTRYVDLTDEIRSELLVRVPLKPLCTRECRGLCPTCGANLNTERCGCHEEHRDPRWDALKDLKPDK